MTYTAIIETIEELAKFIAKPKRLTCIEEPFHFCGGFSVSVLLDDGVEIEEVKNSFKNVLFIGGDS